METIVVAIITGGLSLLGVIITSNKTTRDVQAKLDKQQAVTETKLEELTREVRSITFLRGASRCWRSRSKLLTAGSRIWNSPINNFCVCPSRARKGATK